MRSATRLKLRCRGLALGAACLFLAISGPAPARAGAATPIEHLVVIVQENVSFDHYFATYPHALNPEGSPPFVGAPDTPSIDGLTADLLRRNPNAANPFRLDRSQATACSPYHSYALQLEAYNGGRMDRFVEALGPTGQGCDPKSVMGYYDGNTVTALWTYAQHFASSDRFFATAFGPSTPGALNMISGRTDGATPADLTVGRNLATVAGVVIGDPDPAFDDCARSERGLIAMSGRNVGDLLNAKGVTWGWFQGGFRPSAHAGNGKAVCGSTSRNLAGARTGDYNAHRQPFQYFVSTANPHHLPPTAAAMIGRSDRANHQYDLADFWDAVGAGNLPAVSFLKAAQYQDGHAAHSNPLDEQPFVVKTVNRLQRTPQWQNMAVIITYDDSGGWYDHAMPPIAADPMASGTCGKPLGGAVASHCGYGPRLPLLVLSPYAKRNFVDHTFTDQSSILRFIEDNWGLGRIGGASNDEWAGTLANLFDFAGAGGGGPVFLDPEIGLIE